VNEHRVGTWLFTTVTAMLAGFAAIILSGSPPVIGVAVLVATAAATVVGRSSLPSPARMSDGRGCLPSSLLPAFWVVSRQLACLSGWGCI
jgi:hypothetical protein